MQNRIAYYILSLLYLNGRVRIPGIGRIKQEQKPATVDEQAATIHPPQTSNLFEYDKQNKSRLLERFIAYKAHTSRTRARREIAKFSQGIKSGMKNDGRVEFKYLGTFAMEGDELRFTPDEDLLNPGHSALQSIPLPERLLPVVEDPHAMQDQTIPAMDSQPGAPEIEQEEPTSEETAERETQAQPELTLTPPVEKEEPVVIPYRTVTSSTPVSSETNRPRISPERRERDIPLLVPIAALTLLGLLVGAFLFYQSRIGTESNSVVAGNDTLSQTEQPVSSTGRIPEAAETVSPASETDTKVALADSGSRGEAPLTQSEETKTTESPEAQIPEEPQPENVHTPVPAAGDCLLVLGAFSVNSNVDRMVARLQTMGYTTKTYPRGSLTQVGIPVDCNAPDLKAVLSFLRTNVEQHAWVRKPG